MIKKLMMFAAALCVAGAAALAADLPVRSDAVGVTNTTASTLSMPAFGGNGQIVDLQVVDDGQTNNTFTLKQIIPLGATRAVTNTVATVTYTTTHGGHVAITNATYFASGDSFAGQFGTSSTGLWFIMRTLAK